MNSLETWWRYPATVRSTCRTWWESIERVFGGSFFRLSSERRDRLYARRWFTSRVLQAACTRRKNEVRPSNTASVPGGSLTLLDLAGPAATRPPLPSSTLAAVRSQFYR